MMSVVRHTSDVRCLVSDWKAARRKVGFVPTMGALHAGHARLITESLAECDRTVVSIFVNPLQFDRKDDLESYPRSDEADLALLEELGVHLVYQPREKDMYPEGFVTRVVQEGLTETLCGAARPGHFDGVLTVVLKLFNVVQPDLAWFGQKDYQQVQVIRRMVKDLNCPVEVRMSPIVREADGLALSSRNRLLTPEQRAAAPRIFKALQKCDVAFRSGQRNVDALRVQVARELEGLPEARIDYVEITDPRSLLPRRSDAAEGDLLAVAVYLGAVRLIDNLLLGRS